MSAGGAIKMRRILVAIVVLLIMSSSAGAWSMHWHSSYRMDDMRNPRSYEGVAWRGIGVSTADHQNFVSMTMDDKIYITQRGYWQNRRFLTEGTWPSWSPDGKWIVFGKDNDLYKIRPDGTGLVQLTNTPDTLEDFASWSYDGKMITYVVRELTGKGRSLVVADSDLKNRRVLVTGEDRMGRPRFSPYGNIILYASTKGNTPYVTGTDYHNTDIWRINIDGTGETRLTWGKVAESPTMHHDGTIVITVLSHIWPQPWPNNTPEGVVIGRDLMILRPDGKLYPLLTGRFSYCDSWFSYDSKYLYFSAGHD